MLGINEAIIELYRQEKEHFKVLGLEAYYFNYIREYIDYIANVVLQMLVYRVINKANVNSVSIIIALSEKVDVMDGVIEKQLDRRS